MPIMVRVLSAFFTAVPALVFGTASLVLYRGEYFWLTYVIVCSMFLFSSLTLGFILPAALKDHWLRHPWLWVFIQGILAWLIAFAVLAFLNLTPLCIGQDNGDGNNDISLCMAQTVLIGLVYTPLELIMLTLSTVSGGLLIKTLVK
jgi:hypothetical protein